MKIEISKELELNLKQRSIVLNLASDLKIIKENFPEIEEVIVRGGFLVDLILNTQPNDIDIFYTIKNEFGNYDSTCRCEEIRTFIQKNTFRIINDYKYDIQNSCEQEPKLGATDMTIGFFSYHTDYLSRIALNEKGEIWTNIRTYRFLLDRVHEVRFEGWIPWIFCMDIDQTKNYYAFHVYEIIRSLAHIRRRKLKAGEKFLEFLGEASFIINEAAKTEEVGKLQKYISVKIGGIEQIEEALKSINVSNWNEVSKAFLKIVEYKLDEK